MSSTFGSLNTAVSGLYAAQRGIDVTGQNVTNANTDGYSRQRVDLQSVGASTVPAFWSVSDGVGGGVNSDNVTRIRDAFLEGRAQVQHAGNAQLTTQNDAFTQIQQAFGEPGTTGLQSQLADMWSAWQTVANSAGDPAAGSALIQKTQTVIDGFHSSRAALDNQWTQTLNNLQALVTDVNATTANIATLNQAITRASLDGNPANELRDQRDSLVLHLSEQIGATSQPGQNGSLTVAVGGVTLVSGSSSLSLAVAGPTNPDDMSSTSVSPSDPNFMTSGLPRIVSSVGHTAVATGGTAGGQLATLTDLIPTYRNALDGLAQALAAQVNTQQGNGVDANGNAGSPIFGSAPPATTITAASLTMLTTSPGDLAAASQVGWAGPGDKLVNGSNADAMSQLGQGSGSPDSIYRQMITQLGVQAASTSRNLDIQTAVTTQVDNDRESVSGVDLDEEMTNMLSYQHSYAAAARLISAIDQNLDTLINHTGLVGNV